MTHTRCAECSRDARLIRELALIHEPLLQLAVWRARSGDGRVAVIVGPAGDVAQRPTLAQVALERSRCYVTADVLVVVAFEPVKVGLIDLRIALERRPWQTVV